jgi:phytoene dehydrogenase-like protein
MARARRLGYLVRSMAEAFPLEASLWAASAPPAPVTPPLDASTTADVCVIGAGYAGLSAALHLAERGIRTVVLDAKEPGYGGSGRNGGQVIPGLKYDPDELEAMFGAERGKKLVAFVGGAADVVFELIARHRMEVAHSRNGWIQAVHSPTTLDQVRRRAPPRHQPVCCRLARSPRRRGAAAGLCPRPRQGGARCRCHRAWRNAGDRDCTPERQMGDFHSHRRHCDGRSGGHLHQRLYG